MTSRSARTLVMLLRLPFLVLVFPFLLAWWILRGVGRLLCSFRTWVVLIVLFLIVLVAYYVASDRYTPLTTDAYLQAYVIQVAPRVDGQVTRVYVQENDRVRKGDLLFEIDPRPFEHKVALLTARRANAVQQVAQLASERDALRAGHSQLEAEEKYALAVYEQEEQIYKRSSTTERKYLEALQKHKAAKAALEKSAKLVLKAEQALEARVGREHALVAEAEAQLAEARLNLEFTRIFAPADGYITNLQLRDGAYAHTGQPVLTLIDDGQWFLVANFRENCLERLKAGQPAWVSLDQYPGRLFRARVYSVGWGVQQGQGTPSGRLPEVQSVSRWVHVAQRFQVRLTLDDPSELALRVGMTGTVSIYTDPDCRLNPVTEGIHQLFAWLEYLY